MDQFTNADNEILKNFTGENRRYLKYHSSWDWLLPAYKRFTLLEDKEFVSSHKKTIDEAILNLNIEDTFLYLVSAIKELQIRRTKSWMKNKCLTEAGQPKRQPDKNY